METNSPIYWADGEDAAMQQAVALAQANFKYFWREQYWENRRIIPALAMSAVKIMFSGSNENGEEIVEHMWIGDVWFDGETLYGSLMNDPHDLPNLTAGDAVAVPLAQLSDWLFVCDDQTYGGYTIHAIRAMLDDEERAEHDAAWGLNFGDFHHIQVAYDADNVPENLLEHPMSRNMRERMVQELSQQPHYAQDADENGYTMLHHSAIAGNLNEIQVLHQAGANLNACTQSGKTALDFARIMGWQHLIEYLQAHDAQ